VATKHNLIGKIVIQKIEGYIQTGNDDCYNVRLDSIRMKLPEDINGAIDFDDFDQMVELIFKSHSTGEPVKIKGTERKGRVYKSLPIVINDIKRLKVK
jgi:hypothetical protein